MVKVECLHCGEIFKDVPEGGFCTCNRNDFSVEFFRGKNFIPMILGKKLMEQFKFITLNDTRETYIYENEIGLYQLCENKVLSLSQAELGSFSLKNRLFETLHYIQNETMHERDEVEPPSHLIALKNGILDIKEMTVIDFSEKYFFRTAIPVTYDPNMVCPNIDKFLSEIIAPEDIVTLKEFIAYCLYRGYPIHKAFMFVGGGSNGKSTFLKMLEAFIGKENVSNIPLQRLSDRFVMAELYGKLANYYADLEKTALNETGSFKTLFGDRITAEQKFKNPFTFIPFAKHAFSANRIPETSDDTDAFFRRWAVFNFPNQFHEGDNADENLIDKLTTPEELSGLLNECLRVLPDLLKRGEFTNSRSTEETRERWIRLSDSIMSFIMDDVDTDSEGWLQKEVVFNEFLQYCNEHNYPACNKIEFGRKFPTKIGGHITDERQSVEGKMKTGWRGIKWKTVKTDKTPTTDKTDLSGFM